MGNISRLPVPLEKDASPRLEPAPVRYKYNGIWKYFKSNMDTVFRIKDMRLEPEVVFQGENYINSSTIGQKDLNGKSWISSIAERQNYWLLLPTTVHRMGSSRESEIPLIYVDKNSLKSINIHLNDDVFSIFPRTYFSENWNWRMRHDGRAPFQDSLMYLKVNADELVNLLKNRSEDIDPKFQSELSKLNDLKQEDNPVIFLFTLKDQITF